MPSDFFLAVREVVNADNVAEIFREYFGEDARLDHATVERLARAVAALHAR